MRARAARATGAPFVGACLDAAPDARTGSYEYSRRLFARTRLRMHAPPELESGRPVRSLADSLLGWAAARTDDVAFRYLRSGDVGGEVDELTFGELDRRARAIGGWLQAHDFTGGRALLLYRPGLEFACAFMGCLYGDVVAVPCPAPQKENFSREAHRLTRLADDAGANVVLSTGAALSQMRVRAQELPALAALTWAATEAIPDSAEANWRRRDVAEDSLAFLQYTSGSTSAPRGVMVTHGNLMDQQRVLVHCLGHTPEFLASRDADLLVSWLPVFHDFGLIANILHAIYLGES